MLISIASASEICYVFKNSLDSACGSKDKNWNVFVV
jgi:hypothetical protein